LGESRGNLFSLDKSNSPEWNYLLNSIQLRDSIIHAKAKFEGEYDVSAKVFVHRDRVRELLQGYAWYFESLMLISQRIVRAYEPIERLLKNYSQRLSLNQHKDQSQQCAEIPFWQRATPLERAKDFQEWVEQLPKTNVSLANEAFDRSKIYE
jgi:hypothetical protein